MGQKPKNILIIEDDEKLIDLLKIHLTDANYKTTLCLSGNEGLEKALNNDYDLIILDIMLPDVNGFEICKSIRELNNYIPVLILTAKSEELDKVLGLELGADDYITKPFSIRELIARVKAIFRRIEKLSSDNKKHTEKLHFKDLEIDNTKRIVTLNGNRIELTPKEYDLLYYLASHPGKTFTREEMLKKIWDYDFKGFEHTVNSHINRLRNKIESDITSPKYILTSWGVGYRFNEEMIK